MGRLKTLDEIFAEGISVQINDEKPRKIVMRYCACGFFTADPEVANGHIVGANHKFHYWVTRAQWDADARFRSNNSQSSIYNMGETE